MVDDSHAVGFMGRSGRGTHEYLGVMGRVDILTGTLGQGAGRRQRRLHQRPGRDRRAPAPALAAVSLLELACRRRSSPPRSQSLELLVLAPPNCATGWRATPVLPPRDDRRRLSDLPGEHPIVPIMFGDATLAARMAEMLWIAGSTWSAFPIRWCRRGKPGFARRFPRCTRWRTCSLPSRRFER